MQWDFIAYDKRYNRCVQFVCNSNDMYNEQDPMLTDRQYPSTISGHVDMEVCVWCSGGFSLKEQNIR